MADLTDPQLPSIIQNVFDLAEETKEREEGPHESFSRIIAEVVAAAGFDGMIVPSVRGSRSVIYTNVVIFRPEERWREWSLRDQGFEVDPE